MKFVNVRELKNKTSAVLHQTENGEDVIVTSRGKPCAVIHHLSEDDIEDYILVNHLEFKKKLETAYQESVTGESVDLDTMIRETEDELRKL